MSLKGFHIIFIVLAFLCTAGFCAWTIMDVEGARNLGAQPIGALSGILALAVFIYGAWFVIKKAKTIIV
jgi:riboflavin transporter FmnP